MSTGFENSANRLPQISFQKPKATAFLIQKEYASLLKICSFNISEIMLIVLTPKTYPNKPIPWDYTKKQTLNQFK